MVEAKVDVLSRVEILSPLGHQQLFLAHVIASSLPKSRLSLSRPVSGRLPMRPFLRGISAKVRPFGWQGSHHSFSTSVARWDKATGDNKAYSGTLNLPKTSFPLRATREKSELPYQERTCDELYRWQSENAKGPLWVFHDGPPYANGDLHMGHALNKILKDIINRFHLSQGRKVNYVPGWDCHGLPIENKALQELKTDSRRLPPAEIRKAAEAVAKREVASQMKQFHHFGILADWSKETTYRTLDHKYEMRQLRIFQKMVEKELIYRHYRPVHYSPSSRSALAEAELVYKDDHASLSVYVTFDMDGQAKAQPDAIQELLRTSDSVKLLVWTTTPWTLTANMGIAAHDDLVYLAVKPESSPGTILLLAKDRLEALQDTVGPCEIVSEIQGSDLVGASYKPIFSSLLAEPVEPLKIIHAGHVTSESGSGLVHCAPAHGGEDYQAFQALGLLSSANKMLCHVDGDGKFSSEVAKIVGESAAQELVGKEVLGSGSKAGEGTKQVVDLLKSINALVHSHVLKHRYPYDWKTDKPIIVTATSQWFADLAPIKDDALKALTDVSFYPAISRNRLESFVRSRSEWCISRQRVWGVPIPALHRIGSDETVLDSASLEHILSVLETKGVAHWWNGPVEDFVPPHLQTDRPASEVYRKGTDTMDVWFDSGSSWSMLNEAGLGSEQRDGEVHKRPFLADVCLEGSDQHRGWFQSQLLTAIGSANTPSERVSPYGTLITHGMVLDEKGKKMSKSLGNIISPLTIVLGGKNLRKDPAYGADVLRLWVATVEYWRDMSIGPTVLAQAAESLRKIRNSARFMLANIGDKQGRQSLAPVSKEDVGLAERYMMHELHTLEQTALEGYSSYNFPKVVNAVTNFANITLSSLYFDITKDCLYADSVDSPERQAVISVLGQTLSTMSSVVAPILPHLTEEIHATWKADENQSFFATPWQPLSSEWHNPQAAEDMSNLLQVRGTVLSLLEKARRDKHLKSSLEGVVDLVIPDSARNSQLAQLLQREEQFLKTLFITSDAMVTDEGSLGTSSPTWVYTDTIPIPDTEQYLVVRVRPAELQKCPRCWTFTREEHDDLCHRCENVIGK